MLSVGIILFSLYNILTAPNISNLTNITNETTAEIEVLPNYEAPKLEYQLTNQQKYNLAHYDDPNEFVEEFTKEDVPYQIQKEQNALKEFYHSTNGIFWLRNWDFSKATLCAEYGVTCTDNGYITHLKLIGNNLTGTVPNIFINLQNMIELDLSRNFLSGNIDFIASLTLLQILRLNNNQFVGTIHDDIFAFIESLKIFEIESNYISGTIPSTFGIQRNLQIFRISNNNISGFLPQYLGRHISLKILMASHNKIRGGFPLSFEECKELEILILSHNKLNRQFPPIISTFHNLQILALDNNNLHGNISNLQSLNKLQVLWLHNNNFIGNITQIVNKRNKKHLQDLRLAGNYFDCDLYHDFATIHSDSPLDINLCDAKIYFDTLTNRNITIHSIP